jgi:4-carboxymuconolactone decarboxylase
VSNDRDYLPDVYVDFRQRFPDVATAVDRLGDAADGAGALDERTTRLVKLGIAAGGLAEGAVRSNVRKALAAGVSEDEIWHVAALVVTTGGFPSAVAVYRWISEVLAAQ